MKPNLIYPWGARKWLGRLTEFQLNFQSGAGQSASNRAHFRNEHESGRLRRLLYFLTEKRKGLPPYMT